MICFVVALDAEAKPLIRHFGLTRLTGDHGFPAYHGDNIFLVVSGIGRINAAAATAHLHGIAGFPENAIWINLGIAGHAELAIGDAALAHKITDVSGGRSWYPPMIVHPPWQTLALRTVEQADDSYAHEDLVDMEASGFIETAIRFSTGELVHCLKIISDNRDNPVAIPKPSQVSGWFSLHIETLEEFLKHLGDAAMPLLPHPEILPLFEQLTSQWHFTVSQQNQLRKTLQRWFALNPESRPAEHRLAELVNAAQVLELLEQQLQRRQLEFP